MHDFRYYFTPLTGVLFIFHSRYFCAIGRQGVLSLGGWSPRIHTRFHVSGATWEIAREGIRISHTGLSPAMAGLSRAVPLSDTLVTLSARCRGPARSRYPHDTTPAGLACHRFRLIPVRSPLLWKSRFLSFPAVTKMFQFSALSSGPYVFRHGCAGMTPHRLSHSEVSGSKVGQHLPEAYRSYPTSFIDSWRQNIHLSRVHGGCFGAKSR